MTQCPTPEQLNEFLEEQVSDAQQASIARHVDRCEHCQTRLDELTMATVHITPDSQLIAAVARRSSESDLMHRDFLAKIKENPPSKSDQGQNLSASPGRKSDSSFFSKKFPVVANYEIVSELGRGGMGVVYKARQVGLDRLVALKMILAGTHAGPKDLARFRQEAEAVARLRHSNIIHIYDIGESEGRPFLALEFVEGESLAHFLQGAPQPLAPAARLIETLAGAIHYAHQRNIVHRDLKPANILLQLADADMPTANPGDSASLPAGFRSFVVRELQTAIPKITDFGLAKRLDDHQKGTQTGDVVGTPSYMAPEQASSNGNAVGIATDVYSLGAILYELLTGRPPFRGAASLDTVLQVIHEDPVRPSYLRLDLPRDLETITLKCLAKDPAKRYASADALANDLHLFRKGKPIMARPVGIHERVWKWARHRPVVAALVVGMILTAVLGFAGITWQWQEARIARNSTEIERQEAVNARINEAEQRKKAGASLYFSRIAQSQLQWRVNDFPSAKSTLARCIPQPGEDDHRGWEWHYLQGLFHDDLFTLLHGHSGQGGAVAYDPNGGRIASVVSGPTIGETAQPGEVKIWDSRTGEVLQSLAGPSTVHRLAFSPDGKRLALATNDGQVMVWEAAGGTEIFQQSLHNQAVWALAYSPDGKWIASAGSDKILKIWDSGTGKVRHELRGHDKQIQSIAFHPSQPIIASGSWDTTVKLWNTETGKEIQTLQGHKQSVFCVAFSPDGKSLVSASSNGNVKFWNLSTGEIVQSLTGDTGGVLGLVFSPDGRYIAKAGKDGTVRLWHIATGVERMIFRGHKNPVESVHFSPDARRVVSISPGEGLVKVWDLTRHPTYATFARTESDSEAISFSENGQRLLSVSLTGKLQAWDGSTGLLLDERLLPLNREMVSPGVPVAFSAAGKLLAGRSAEDARVVKTWETITGAEAATFTGHTLPVTCIRFSSNARFLATCACEKSGLWRVASGEKRPQAIPLPKHEVKVWDASTGKVLATLTGTGRIFSVAFSLDGRWLAWGGQDGVVTIASVSEGEKGRKGEGEHKASPGDTISLSPLLPFSPSSMHAHQGDVSALAFHPDGHLLASAGMEDRTVKLWKVPATDSLSPSPLLPFSPSSSLAGPSQICDLAFSPNGKRLAAISRDMVKMWETENGHEVLTLKGAPQRYSWDQPFNPRLAFSPDGTQLAGSNWDESISIWEAPPLDNEEQHARFQEKRRRFADQRTNFWHLLEAELCLSNKNLPAMQFHLNRLSNETLSPPLELRRQRLEAALKKK